MRLNLKHMLCLLLIIAASACTEEISEEVKKSETLSEETGSERSKYVNKSIRVVNKMDSSLSYILHKAGSLQEACELDSPTLGFSSDNYDKTDSASAIDCIIDAQEYDLYFSGAQFEIQVDQNLCEYVKYEPFKFLQYPTGESKYELYRVECDSECQGNGVVKACNKVFRGINTTLINTGMTIDPYYTYNSANPYDSNYVFHGEVTEPDKFSCRFDYTNQKPKAGPNCDEGKITIQTIKISASTTGLCSDATYTTETSCIANGESWSTIRVCDSSAVNELPSISFEEKLTEECGGKKSACIEGPVNEVITDHKYTGVIYQNLELNSFSHDITVSAPKGLNYSSNQFIANFSRVCSSTSNTKTNAQFDTSLTDLIGHEVEDMPERSAFKEYEVDDNGDGKMDYTVSADHPFKGAAYYSNSVNTVTPYYALYCLDQARDVKAQIRVFIREWDKDFSSTNPYLARLSDINQTNPYMDSSGDQAPGEPWNDLNDWDDLFSDYDYNSSNDLDGDGSGFDPLFTNNQCTLMKYGYCFEKLPIYTTEATCTAATYTWYGYASGAVYGDIGFCARDLTAYTDEEDCEDNGGEWKRDFCSDRSYFNQADCEDAGEVWHGIELAFPGQSL